ncbi:MAG: tail fiber protein [Pseudanabaena sp. M151S2SP2A07QC]|nr:tail fiber protein [Pseudanabaena sp. M151S2SP2A07QC]
MEQAGAAGCIYQETTSTGLTNFVSMGIGSGCSSWTTVGPVLAVGTNDHRLQYNAMPPGNYKIELAGSVAKSVSGTCLFRLSDGTNNFQPQIVASSNDTGVNSLHFTVTYTTTADRTFTLQASDDHAGVCAFNNNTVGYNASWKIYRFPTQAEQIVSPANSLDSLGTVFYVAGSQCPAGSLAADGAAVSRTAYAPLFARVGVTHGAGDGSTTFNLPDLRGIFVRGAGSQTVGSVTYSGTLGTKQNDQFQGHWHEVQTATTSDAIFRAGAGANGGNGGTTDPNFRYVAKGIISDGVNGTPRVGAQTQPGNISLTPCISTAFNQAPLLVGSVTSGSSGMLRHEYVHIGQGSYQTNCTVSPCGTFRPSSSWVSSVTRSSTGIYVVNIPAGIFSSGGVCTCSSVAGGTGSNSCSISDFTGTQVTVYAHTGAGVARDGFVDLTCTGPR